MSSRASELKSSKASSDALEEMDPHSQVDPTSLEASDCTSFKHVCFGCQSATWWYPIAVLTGLLEQERGE